jgi:hypothetical protein
MAIMPHDARRAGRETGNRPRGHPLVLARMAESYNEALRDAEAGCSLDPPSLAQETDFVGETF